MKILIVDDNNYDRMLLKCIVERNGHEVIEAGDGQQGLTQAAACRPDLIISDALMPVMDGFQFLKKIKADRELTDIPFMFYSATYTGIKDMEFGLSLGAEAYILKPVEPATLWAEVERVLRGAKKTKDTGAPAADDSAYLQRYNQIVVAKLQDKVAALEKALAEKEWGDELIRRSLNEKEVMLKEIHHRVKNNLNVINGLLAMQAKRLDNGPVRAILDECRNRINSMALIHDCLYKTKDFASVDFKHYLQGLVRGIAATYHRPEIVVTVEMSPITLDVNSGIPCGLIVNELVTNSMKHAFPPGKTGTIKVGLALNNEGERVLIVADDGIGLAAGVDLNNPPSLGLQLVTGLAGQINGRVEVDREGGTRVSVTFPGLG